MLHHFGPLTRTDLVTVYRGYFNDRNNDSDTPAHEWWDFLYSTRDTLVERLVEVCRPDDDNKDAERSAVLSSLRSDNLRHALVPHMLGGPPR